jgi:hypothetical protein
MNGLTEPTLSEISGKGSVYRDLLRRFPCVIVVAVRSVRAVVFGWTRLAKRSYELPLSVGEFHPAPQLLSPERTRVSLSLLVRYNPRTCKQSTKPPVVATGC